MFKEKNYDFILVSNMPYSEGILILAIVAVDVDGNPRKCV